MKGLNMEKLLSVMHLKVIRMLRQKSTLTRKNNY